METVEATVLGIKPIPDKPWQVLKCAGSLEFMAWKGGLNGPELAQKLCVVGFDPAKDGRSPSLRKLTVKETGEVVYEDEGKKGRGSSSYAKDPAERASIEAQSALAHTLQEVRMAKDLLLGIVTATAPYQEALTPESALTFVTTNLEDTVKVIRGIRGDPKTGFGKLADELAKVRSRNMGPSSESGSRTSGAADPGDRARGKSHTGGGTTTPADDGEPPPAPAGDGPGSGSDASPVGIAKKRADALSKFGNMAGFREAFARAFGEPKTPGQATESELDAMLSEEVPA